MMVTTAGTLHWVAVGVKVEVGVGVSEGVGVMDGVQVGPAMVAGSPTTLAVRKFSTMPSRLAERCRVGHHELKMGVIRGWSKSTLTDTRSPGPPASSTGRQSAETGVFGSEAVYHTPVLFEHTVTLKYPGVPTLKTESLRRIATAPERTASSMEGMRAPSSSD